MKSFGADYHSPAHPAVVQAVQKAASQEVRQPYGEDEISHWAKSVLRYRLGLGPGVLLFVPCGTAGNMLAVAGRLGGAGESALCLEGAHIYEAECGAVERLGYKLTALPTREGKLDPALLEPYVEQRKDRHQTYPSLVSIADATELGTVYSREELQGIREAKQRLDFRLHLDGARLANAFASAPEKGPAARLAWLKPDVVSLGAAKNGGLFGEAVFFRCGVNDPEDRRLRSQLPRLQKQLGMLCPRQHLIAAQFLALFGEGFLGLKNATQANRMAALLADRCRDELGLVPAYLVQSNAVFLRLGEEARRHLAASTPFYVWNQQEGIVRLMCSWDTRPEDVDELVGVLRKAISL